MDLTKALKIIFLFFCVITLSSIESWSQPTILSFSPQNGPVGTIVTISGTNFDPLTENNIVYFGSTRASVVNASLNELQVSVPIGATYMPITVMVGGLISYSSLPFVVTYAINNKITGGSFETKIDFVADTEPISLAIGDLDGDGKPDLAVANQSKAVVSVYRNNSSGVGNISYEPRVDYTAASVPTSICISDFTGDGKLDLAVSNWGGNNVSVFKNKSTPGNISFDSKVDFQAGYIPHAVYAGDFDGDGKPDLATANFGDNSVSIIRNNGANNNLSFEFNIDYLAGTAPWSITIGDLDGDKKVDIVSANRDGGNVSTFLNKSTGPGDISFYSKVDFTTDADPWSVALGDLDNDGKLDIVTANNGSLSISVLRNNSTLGSLDFETNIDYTTAAVPRSVAINDISGDGKVDIAVSIPGSNFVSIFKNETIEVGSITFNTKVSYPTGTSPYSVAAGDLDADGKVDLAVVNLSEKTLSVFRNKNVGVEAEIHSFYFPEQTGLPTIDPVNYTINVEVAKGTDRSLLTPEFILSTGAVAKVGGVIQESSITSNDYSSSLIYTVTSEDGITTKDWTVTVSIVSNSETDILSFLVPDQTEDAVIDTSNKSVNITVKYGTDLTNLVPTFTLSDGASAYIGPNFQTSGFSEVDFTTNKTYTILAEDNTTSQDWEVQVNEEVRNTEADFISFSIPDQATATVINTTDHTIELKMDYGVDLTNLVASFELSKGALASVGGELQASSITANDFTNELIYYVVSEDSITHIEWRISVTNLPNNETDILAFTLTQQTSEPIIDLVNHKVDVEVEYGIDLTSLAPSFELSDGATASIDGVAQVSGVTTNDYTNSLIYKVVAEDGDTSVNWEVHVKYAPNTVAFILEFSLPGQKQDAIIDPANNTVDVTLEFGTDLTSLAASFELSYGATAYVKDIEQVSGTSVNDFTNPIVYTIVAENGSSLDWTISISVVTALDNLNSNLRFDQLYPNPFASQIAIPVNGKTGSTLRITMLDQSGRIIYKDQVDITKGEFEYVIETNKLNSKLYKGIYLLNIELNSVKSNETIRRKVVYNGD